MSNKTETQKYFFWNLLSRWSMVIYIAISALGAYMGNSTVIFSAVPFGLGSLFCNLKASYHSYTVWRG